MKQFHMKGNQKSSQIKRVFSRQNCLKSAAADSLFDFNRLICDDCLLQQLLFPQEMRIGIKYKALNGVLN